MKRRIVITGLVLGCLPATQGCKPAEPVEAPAPPTTAGWVTSPLVVSVARSGAGLTLRGMTAPQGRVVVRGDGAEAYATSADAQGRFELQASAPVADALFVVETRTGQEASPAPYRLLVSRGAAGPVALLAPGAPTVRLDHAGPLDVIDSDGHASLASGRAAVDSTVAVSVNGQQPMPVRAGPDGRWNTTLDLIGSGPATVTVGSRSYAYPGAAVASVPGVVRVSAGDGWRVSWALAQGAGQSSWFPEP